MKTLCYLFVFTVFISSNVFACQKTTMSYDEIALASKAVYVGGVVSVAINDDLNEQQMYGDLNYPNEVHRSDRVIRMNVFQTLSGEEKERLEVTVDWCNGKQAKLGEMAILYQLESGWYLKHDEFAISESMAVLSKRSASNSQIVALQ